MINLNQYVSINALDEDEKYCWVANYSLPGIFQIDKDTLDIKLVHAFVHTRNPMSKIIRKIIKRGSWLYLFPSYTHEFMVYDLEKKSLSTLSYSSGIDNSQSNEGEWVADVVRVECKLWIFPTMIGNPILIYDMNTGLFEKLEFNYDELERLIHMQQTGQHSKRTLNKIMNLNIIHFQDYMIGTIYDCSILFKINIKTKKIDFIDISHDYHLNFISSDHNKIWLTLTDRNMILEWNMEQNTVKEILLADGTAYVPFRLAIPFEQKLIIMPCFSSEIYIYDQSTGNIQKKTLPFGYKMIHDPDKRSKFNQYYIKDRKIYLLPYSGNEIVIYDIDKDTLTGNPLIYGTEQYNSFLNLVMNQNETLVEGEFLSLDKFLNLVVSQQYDLNQQIDTKQNVKTYGQTIFEEVMKLSGR